MAEKKDTNSKENAWKDYLSSIEKKPQKSAKKSSSIGQKFKSFFEKVRIGKPKKSKTEEIKKQVEISAKEAKKWPIEKRLENKPAIKGIYNKPTIVSKADAEKTAMPTQLKGIAEQIKAKKITTVEKKPDLKKPKEKISEKKGYPSKREKYITRIEKKQRTGKKEREVEKLLAEKRSAEEKEKRFVKKMEKAIPKKVLLLPKNKKEKNKSVVSKKISFMPKAGEKKAEKDKKTKIKKMTKARLKEPVSKKVIAAFFKPELNLAKKSIEEIKKLSPKEIKKEVKKEMIEKKARGWYGDSLKHKKAALAGWRLRKKVKLHQLKIKERTKPLTNKEKKVKKLLINEDKELRLKIQELNQKIRSLKKITVEKNKENKVLEKKIKAVGFEIPKAEIIAIEKEKGVPEKKEDMQQIVQVMKTIANEMATTASSQKLASVEQEGAMPIEDNIRTQEKLIKSLERAFYKRKVDFNQFKEKMFDYQSKLTEMKIRKKIYEEKLARMTPEMRKIMEKRIEAGRKGTGIGLTQKTAEALEKMATKKESTGIEEKNVEAIKKLAEKETERTAKEEEEKRFAEKTASALEKISAKLGKYQEQPQTAPRQAQPYTEQVQPHPYPPAPAQPTGKKEKAKKRTDETAPQARAPAYKSNVYSGPTYQNRPSGRGREEMPRPAAYFYDKKPVKKKRFLGKIKEKVVPKQTSIAPEVDRAIREKAASASPAISKEQIDRVEEKLGKLLQKYSIPNQILVTHIKTLDSNRLADDFQKLIRLIETKKESAVIELIKPAAGYDIKSGIISKKKEKIVGKEKEIRRAKIETSFDRLLNLVKMKGIINVKDAAAQSGMSKKEVQECAEILERSRLIKLSYPPIGPVKLIYPAYLKWKLNEKKKKREAKKKKK